MYKEIEKFEDLPKIIAVDFDGTLVENDWPNIGEPNKKLFGFLNYLRQNKNVKLILWTCRNYSEKYGDMLEDAIEFCKNNGLEFDAINENIIEVQRLTGEDTRKVYADIYLDDKSVVPWQAYLYWCEKIGVSWDDLVSHFGLNQKY